MPGEKHDREDIWQYIWRGNYMNVENGTDMLIQLCTSLRHEKPEIFERLPDTFPTARKQWFVRSNAHLHRGHRFHDSDICLDTNMSSERKKAFARELLRFFGFGAEEIRFNSLKRTKP